MKKKQTQKIIRPEVLLKTDMAAMSRAAAEIFVTAAQMAVEGSGRFTVALSGGTTPRVLHKMLAEKSFSPRIPWDRTHIFWVDERCVPVDDLASNYGSAKKDLLDRVPIPRENIHPMPSNLPSFEGARQYLETLVDFFKLKRGQFPVFDLIFLGIGNDGHTASLFPNHPALEETERLTTHVKGGDPFVNRITLTLPVLNRSRQVVFLVSGKGKAEVVRTVFKGEPEPPPAGRVAPLFGRLTWLLDLKAATLLSKKV